MSWAAAGCRTEGRRRMAAAGRPSGLPPLRLCRNRQDDLAKHIAEGVGDVAFGAYTGKAALVCARRVRGAPTIHSLIYRCARATRTPQFVLNRSSSAARTHRRPTSARWSTRNSGATSVLRPPSWSWATASSRREGRRLLHGGGIRRDADRGPSPGAGRPDRAHVDAGARGRTAGAGSYGESRVVRRREIQAETVAVGRPGARRAQQDAPSLQYRIRELSGFRDPMPAAGEKLVCLRNDKIKGFSTAAPGRSMRSAASGATTFGWTLSPTTSRRRPAKSPCTSFFEGGEEDLPFPARVRRVHVRLRPDGAQGPGSQWDDLVLFDESHAFREHRSAGSIRVSPGPPGGDRRSGAGPRSRTGGNRISVLRVFRPSSAF